MKKLARAVVLTFALFLSGIGLSSPAVAAEPSVDERVEVVLKQFPGGTRVAVNEVSWDGGNVVLTFASGATTKSVGSCATGKFCAFSAGSLGGSKLTFSSCTATNSTAPLGVVRSFANARSSGTVYAYNGSTSVASTAASSWTNTTATITRLGC